MFVRNRTNSSNQMGCVCVRVCVVFHMKWTSDLLLTERTHAELSLG